MFNNNTTVAFIDDKHDINILPSYCYILQGFLIALFLVVFPIGVTILFITGVVQWIDLGTFLILKLVLTVIVIICFTAVALFIGLILMSLIMARFTRGDTLSFAKDALIFNKREKILFKDIKTYRTHVRVYNTRRYSHRFSYKYSFYLEIEQPEYARFMIEYCGPSIFKHKQYDNKSFSENTCAIIDKWQRNQSQSAKHTL